MKFELVLLYNAKDVEVKLFSELAGIEECNAPYIIFWMISLPLFYLILFWFRVLL